MQRTAGGIYGRCEGAWIGVPVEIVQAIGGASIFRADFGDRAAGRGDRRNGSRVLPCGAAAGEVSRVSVAEGAAPRSGASGHPLRRFAAPPPCSAQGRAPTTASGVCGESGWVRGSSPRMTEPRPDDGAEGLCKRPPPPPR